MRRMSMALRARAACAAFTAMHLRSTKTACAVAGPSFATDLAAAGSTGAVDSLKIGSAGTAAAACNENAVC